MSGLVALCNGTYDRRIQQKNLELDRALTTQVFLQAEADRTDIEREKTDSELKAAELKLSSLLDQLNQLDYDIQRAKADSRMKEQEYMRYKKEINRLTHQAVLITKSPDLSTDQRSVELQELEKKRKNLMEALQSALSF